MTKADYWCEHCYHGHTLTSKIGRAHIQYARDQRIREKWTKIFAERSKIKENED